MAKGILVRGAGEAATNGLFRPRSPTVVPAGFARTCDEMGWASEPTWKRLSDGTRRESSKGPPTRAVPHKTKGRRVCLFGVAGRAHRRQFFSQHCAVCLSVGWLVGWSVGRSVGRSDGRARRIEYAAFCDCCFVLFGGCAN